MSPTSYQAAPPRHEWVEEWARERRVSTAFHALGGAAAGGVAGAAGGARGTGKFACGGRFFSCGRGAARACGTRFGLGIAAFHTLASRVAGLLELVLLAGVQVVAFELGDFGVAQGAELAGAHSVDGQSGERHAEQALHAVSDRVGHAVDLAVL